MKRGNNKENQESNKQNPNKRKNDIEQADKAIELMRYNVSKK